MPLKCGYAQHDGYLSPSEDVSIHKICTNGYEFFGIFDGHGGIFFSREASDLLSRGLEQILTSDYDTTEISLILSNLFDMVNSILFENYSNVVGGTTGIIAVVTPNNVITAHVGDSAGMLISKKTTENLTYYTKDHTPEEPEEYNRVLRAGGTVTKNSGDVYRINSRLAVSRSFGDWIHKNLGLIATPTINIWPRQNNTILALYSDSFSEKFASNTSDPQLILNLLSKSEIYKNLQKYITNEPNLMSAAETAVMEQVNKFRSPLFGTYNGDNTSLIFVDLSI